MQFQQLYKMHEVSLSAKHVTGAAEGERPSLAETRCRNSAAHVRRERWKNKRHLRLKPDCQVRVIAVLKVAPYIMRLPSLSRSQRDVYEIIKIKMDLTSFELPPK